MIMTIVSEIDTDEDRKRDRGKADIWTKISREFETAIVRMLLSVMTKEI